MGFISVFEHEAIKVGEHGFSESHLQALERFIGNNDETTFPYYSLIHNGVKFRQYVGVLCVDNITIEVLPKTDRDNCGKDYWRDKLIFMLSKVYRLDVKTPSTVNQKTVSDSPVLDVFIKCFLDEVDKLVNCGLVKCYHKDEDNQKVLRGKLLINKQIQSNFVHKERFFVRYTTYDYEHVVNRIIRQTLGVVIRTSHNTYLRYRATSILFNFPEVKDIVVTQELFENLYFDRKTDDYKTAIRIAQLLLLHYAPAHVGGSDNYLALMFDMNKLWEEFIYCTLGKKLSDYEVSSQVVKRYWHFDETNVYKTIRPDIVITKGKTVVAVLDTKWKCLDKTPSDGDLHQMFVYSQMFKTRKVALLYPSYNENSLRLPAHFMNNSDSNCDMLFLGLSQNNNGWCEQLKKNVCEWLNPSNHGANQKKCPNL